MKTNVKKLKDCKTRMTVEVEPARVEERYKEVLREFQKKAALPGFREGKAPLDMVEKRYAREAEEETLKSLVPEAYHQAVATQKDKIVPVALPAISEINFQKGKPLTFAAEFEREPEFSLKSYKGIKLKKVGMEVETHEVEKGMKSLLDSRAEIVAIAEPREVKAGDLVVTDIHIWNEGDYKPGRESVLLAVEQNPDDDFYDKVVGAKVHDVREISVEASPEEKAKGVVGRKPMYKILIKEIKEKKLPALDDEFAKIFGKETVAELHEAIRKDIAAHKKNQAFDQMKIELYEKLLSSYSFELPENLVTKQKERLVEQSRRQAERSGVSHQQFEKEKAKIEEEAAKRAADQVKLYFILQKIAEAESVEVDEIELEQRLNRLAGESKRPVEEVRQVFEEDIRESMRETKTVDFLISNANLQDEKSN